jgi:mannose-6-phosphate isomerase-like protein (cupin superfamily)
MTSGAAGARIGGRELTLETGTCTLVPAGVSHELWSRGTEPAELVIVMFGDGA